MTNTLADLYRDLVNAIIARPERRDALMLAYLRRLLSL